MSVLNLLFQLIATFGNIYLLHFRVFLTVLCNVNLKQFVKN